MSEVEYDSVVNIQAFNKDLIRTGDLHDPLVLRLRIDLGRTLSKNSLVDRLVRPMRKFAKSVIKTSSKV